MATFDCVIWNALALQPTGRLPVSVTVSAVTVIATLFGFVIFSAIGRATPPG